MTIEASGMAVETPSALRELAPALRELHHLLLQECRADYERTHGPVPGPGQLLHLAMFDPFFSWLRVLSALMADLDELLEQKEPPTDEEAAAVRGELEEIFSPAHATFWRRCAPLLQNPIVAISYGHLPALISRLPRTPAAEDAAVLHAQHRWSVARRKRGAT